MSSWSIPLDRLAAKTGARIEQVGRKITFEVFNAIQLRSPVKTGRFRANWQVGNGQIAKGIVDAKDPGGTAAAAEAAKALQISLGGTVYFTNSLPYAQPLEYGSSDQAPNGMVRLTLREVRALVTKALAS